MAVRLNIDLQYFLQFLRCERGILGLNEVHNRLSGFFSPAGDVLCKGAIMDGAEFSPLFRVAALLHLHHFHSDDVDLIFLHTAAIYMSFESSVGDSLDPHETPMELLTFLACFLLSLSFYDEYAAAPTIASLLSPLVSSGCLQFSDDSCAQRSTDSSLICGGDTSCPIRSESQVTSAFFPVVSKSRSSHCIILPAELGFSPSSQRPHSGTAAHGDWVAGLTRMLHARVALVARTLDYRLAPMGEVARRMAEVRVQFARWLLCQLQDSALFSLPQTAFAPPQRSPLPRAPSAGGRPLSPTSASDEQTSLLDGLVANASSAPAVSVSASTATAFCSADAAAREGAVSCLISHGHLAVDDDCSAVDWRETLVAVNPPSAAAWALLVPTSPSASVAPSAAEDAAEEPAAAFVAALRRALTGFAARKFFRLNHCHGFSAPSLSEWRVRWRLMPSTLRVAETAAHATAQGFAGTSLEAVRTTPRGRGRPPALALACGPMAYGAAQCETVAEASDAVSLATVESLAAPEDMQERRLAMETSESEPDMDHSEHLRHARQPSQTPTVRSPHSGLLSRTASHSAATAPACASPRGHATATPAIWDDWWQVRDDAAPGRIPAAPKQATPMAHAPVQGPLVQRAPALGDGGGVAIHPDCRDASIATALPIHGAQHGCPQPTAAGGWATGEREARGGDADRQGWWGAANRRLPSLSTAAWEGSAEEQSHFSGDLGNPLASPNVAPAKSPGTGERPFFVLRLDDADDTPLWAS